MFVKFRASAWWWGLVLLFQGLWLSFVVIVSSNSAVQVFLICLVLVTYSTICCVVVPWRHPGIWLLDVCSHVFLTLLCGTLFTGRRQQERDYSAANWMSWGLFLSPFLIGLAVFGAHVGLKCRFKNINFLLQSEALAAGFSQASQVEVLASILQRLPLYDVMQLVQAKNMLVTEMGARMAPEVSPQCQVSEDSAASKEPHIMPETFIGRQRLSFRSESVQPCAPQDNQGSVQAAAFESFSSLQAGDNPGMVYDE